MKVFMVMNFNHEIDGCSTIHIRKNVYLFKEQAFADAKKIGPTAVVYEFVQTSSWSYDEIRWEERDQLK